MSYTISARLRDRLARLETTGGLHALEGLVGVIFPVNKKQTFIPTPIDVIDFNTNW